MNVSSFEATSAPPYLFQYSECKIFGAGFIRSLTHKFHIWNMVISLAFDCLQFQIILQVESPKLPTKTKFIETCLQNVNSVKRTVKMYSECSVRRVCLMDLLLAPIPPASVGQQTLILSKMAALANLRLSLKLMHPAAHSNSYQAKCQAGRKKRPNSPQVLSFRFSSKKS